MNNRFRTMPCYLLAGGRRNLTTDFQPVGSLSRLERCYRHYARIFERVTLVLKPDQARERYLNYPYICDDDTAQAALVGITSAVQNAPREAVFVGSTELDSWPMQAAVDLVREYRGEMFLGYRVDGGEREVQPLFGIYNRKIIPLLQEALQSGVASFERVLRESGRFLELPDSVPDDSLGFSRAVAAS